MAGNSSYTVWKKQTYCVPALKPTILWQCGQQKTRLTENHPRFTSISFSTFFSQKGQTGKMSFDSIFTAIAFSIC